MQYQTKNLTSPDSAYFEGHIKYLVENNKGRYLDDRRTPGKIIKIDPHYALFYWEISDFEDAGAVWELPFEAITDFQFEKDSSELSEDMQEYYSDTIKKYERKLHIKPLSRTKTQTEHEVNKQAQEIITAHSICFEHCTTLSALFEMKNAIHDIFQDYININGLSLIEQQTSEVIVSNPYAGEWLKHLFIALANMGFVEYRGRLARPLDSLPSGHDFKQYIIKRLAFIRALFLSNTIETIPLYRGMSSSYPWTLFPKAFSSWTSEYSVAKDLAEIEENNDKEVSYILKRKTHINEIFMSCLETSAMNKKYDEKEFLLFCRPDKGVF